MYQLHLILAIRSSLERSHGDHSRDTLLYTVAQILIILFNFCVINTDYNLGIRMITINVAKYFNNYLFYCKMNYSKDKSTQFSGSEIIINGLCRHMN